MAMIMKMAATSHKRTLTEVALATTFLSKRFGSKKISLTLQAAKVQVCAAKSYR